MHIHLNRRLQMHKKISMESSSCVNSSIEKPKKHYFQTRDFDLAARVQKLPAGSLIDSFELAALTGIAPTSFVKPAQRAKMGLPSPIRVGRLLKWRLNEVRLWLGEVPGEKDQKEKTSPPGHTRPGRPTKEQQLARQNQVS